MHAPIRLCIYIYVYKFIQDTMRGIKHDGCVGSVIYSIYTVTCIIHVQVYLYASTSHIYTYTHIYINIKIDTKIHCYASMYTYGPIHAYTFILRI